MIPQETDIFEEGDLEGEVIEFTISPEDLPEIMANMTDMYKFPEMAVIRELSTNARDSHVEAGKADVPIKVFKPNDLEASLIIKDEGVGLSLDDIRTVYTRYGASTRRLSNDYTGRLGMGSKSPMAYCGKLKVVSVKDGLKTVAIMTRRENNSAAMQIVSHTETDLPEGVEITVPRKEPGDFDSSVDWFFSFWDEGTVLVDGEPPKPIEGTRLGTSIVLCPQVRRGQADYQDIVVMGGVPYPVDSRYKLFAPAELDAKRAMICVCYVNMGSVRFTPNRESLIYNERTEKTLTKLRLEIAGRIKWMIERELAAAPNHWAALLAHRLWLTEYGYMIDGPQYKGDPIPKNFKFEAYKFKSRIHSWETSRNGTRSHYERVQSLNGMTLKDLMEFHRQGNLYPLQPGPNGNEPLIVVGAPYQYKTGRHYGFEGSKPTRELTQAAKVKIRKWATYHQVKSALICFEHPDEKWLSGLNVVPWERVLAAKDLNKAPSAESYSFLNLRDIPVKVADLPPEGRGVIYVNPSRSGTGYNRITDSSWGGLGWLNRVRPGEYKYILQVPPRRLAKFIRHCPRALPAHLVVDLELAKLEKAVRHHNLKALLIDTADSIIAKHLRPYGPVDDPDVQELLDLVGTKPTKAALNALHDYKQACAECGRVMKLDRSKVLRLVPLMKERYPLLNRDKLMDIDEKYVVHAVEYMNWRYRELTKLNGHANGLVPRPEEVKWQYVG